MLPMAIAAALRRDFHATIMMVLEPRATRYGFVAKADYLPPMSEQRRMAAAIVPPADGVTGYY